MAQKLLSSPWRRLTCRGDLATSRLRAINPPSHFLVGAGHSCWCDVVTGIILGSYSCYYAIVRGRGREWEEKNREHGEGEMIVNVATMETNGNEKQDLTHKSEGKQCSLYSLFAPRRMKTKSKDLSFIHGPFEGRLNPKLALRPLSPILFLLVAHGLDKWITNVWTRTMLLA